MTSDTVIRLRAPESRIAKHFVLWSYANSALTITSGILLVPFYLRSIGKENYGVWAAATGYCGILSLFELGVSYIAAQQCGRLVEAADAATGAIAETTPVQQPQQAAAGAIAETSQAQQPKQTALGAIIFFSYLFQF